MTIAELIKDLTEYAKDNEKGFDTEVRSYVGMSRQAAEQRLQECESDEYVFDDFLPISYIHEMDGFVYIRATDIPEVEQQESENKYISIGITDDCKNLEESYGEICVRCNKCGRFDKEKAEENGRGR